MHSLMHVPGLQIQFRLMTECHDTTLHVYISNVCWLSELIVRGSKLPSLLFMSVIGFVRCVLYYGPIVLCTKVLMHCIVVPGAILYFSPFVPKCWYIYGGPIVCCAQKIK